MTLYGFKLYMVEATVARSHERLQFTAPGLARFADHDGETPQQILFRQLYSMRDTKFVGDATYKAIGSPPVDPNTLPARTPCLRIDEVYSSGNRIEVMVTYGRKGEFPTAVSLGPETDIPLDARAAARPYRVLFYFPREGSQAVMVAEVIGRSHVGQVLLSRLSVENAVKAAQQSALGEEVAWLRYLQFGVFDEARIAEVVNDGEIEGVSLRRHAVSAAGVRRTKDLTLTQAGLPAGKRGAARQLVGRWVKKKLGHEVADPVDVSVAAMLEFVDTDTEALEEFGFTDGEFRFNTDGKSQGLGPSNLERILMYPTGNTQLSTVKLHAAATKRLIPLMASLTVPIQFS